MTSGKTYTLLGADRRPYESPRPGTFGGHRPRKIYGRLDCRSALRAIARGGYVNSRVFFADEETALAAGYRPCARCLPAEYQEWKHRHPSTRSVTPTSPPRARHMNLYRRYFDLVASGRKTIEVRVQYANLRNLAAGQYIRFACGTDECLTRVVRVARYTSFDEMLDTESPANVNPDSPRQEQLANIRRIYTPEKEALGVLAIQIERV
ncbi:ASCH domain-containing protein [Streptosporangium sp. NBC_01495]|uniref:ASCH domain-containing protein n=1 Tax=Streptosporangium sp. NBC_01495 TaxID=2903899 RepID=UPI002E301122|nr:ASCH domain-containing protein [Streptosporangium sp. NBC_01495]